MSETNVNEVLQHAAQAFDQYRNVSGKQRAAFLRAIAEGLEADAETIVQLAQEETNLPEARIKGEVGRTTGQLRAIAALVAAGHWVQATIDNGDASRKPLPKPDLRKLLVPVGPVVVFGASNFPLAFSTAGGDTASALAAGCSVVVKSHPAHPKTSARVAGVIDAAIGKCDMPEFVFQHVEDSSIEVGQRLVSHPLTKAVAFTGSRQGGMALFGLASQRPEPIPVFAEMGSVNPMVVLPESIATNETLPKLLAASVLQGVGQFCTNPGLILVMECEGLKRFLDEFAAEIGNSVPCKMLHSGIASNYSTLKKKALAQAGVSILSAVAEANDDTSGAATVAVVNAVDFVSNPQLQEEVFGPFSLIVTCNNVAELGEAINVLSGQLTSSFFGSAIEIAKYSEIVNALQQRCGRMIFNGVPTGVEVCKAMHHGGPFPSTTDSRFTSVGNDAIYRFVRPFSFQNAPEALLPPELQNENPLEILRCVDNEWTVEPVLVLN
ncbi:aldehyde dehydrogenase (NADP(+)) [Chryseolinea lacunae]|uniref:Aldehyde dehydrogenase (NADP(+)) n=1 Tax=Chryseolinea lacunae TaxID=2801331 RepID=A0ABS1KK65_9BACT|nr:aldehyde dehydrogenase (NADP(+)) [Chryseolinea lacunae]MBL0739831.1 aldehyde dehydrogenase (NADP(+)) [Chryseolinea lacunae]